MAFPSRGRAFWTSLPGQGRWAFTLGVDNVLDEDVPICYSCDLNSFDGTLYPIPGRYFYGRVNYYID